MKVEIYDLCRRDSSTRTYKGDFYPSSTVAGMASITSGVINNPGDSNSISFTFTEGIDSDTDIYTDNLDGTATVEFCLMVGLYDASSLVNFAEVKLTYNVDLTTSFTSLTGYLVSQAETATVSDQGILTYTGQLQAYFCDPVSYVQKVDDGSLLHQGDVLSVCFKAPDGQFEVADVVDLSIKDAIDSDPTQVIVSNMNMANPSISEKTCTDTGTSDTNVCVVSFYLTAEFYDFHSLTMSGSGSVLLELGDAPARRQRRLRQSLPASLPQRRLTAETRKFSIYPYTVRIKPVTAVEKLGQQLGSDSGTLSRNIKVIIGAAVGAAFLVLACAVQLFIHLRRKQHQLMVKNAYKQKQAYLDNDKSELSHDFSIREYNDDGLFQQDCLTASYHQLKNHQRDGRKTLNKPVTNKSSQTTNLVINDDDEIAFLALAGAAGSSGPEPLLPETSAFSTLGESIPVFEIPTPLSQPQPPIIPQPQVEEAYEKLDAFLHEDHSSTDSFEIESRDSSIKG